MKTFILVYYGQPEFKSAEEAKRHQGLWMEWAKKLGPAIIQPGNPAKPGKMVSTGEVRNTDQHAFSGFTLIQAESLEEAVAYTQNCPFVTDGGMMSVHETVTMKGANNE